MYKYFGELEEGESFWFSVFVGKELKSIWFIKKDGYGIPVNPIPQIKKVRMNYNDLTHK